jgi:hypothetical protein
MTNTSLRQLAQSVAGQPAGHSLRGLAQVIAGPPQGEPPAPSPERGLMSEAGASLLRAPFTTVQGLAGTAAALEQAPNLIANKLRPAAPVDAHDQAAVARMNADLDAAGQQARTAAESGQPVALNLGAAGPGRALDWSQPPVELNLGRDLPERPGAYTRQADESPMAHLARVAGQSKEEPMLAPSANPSGLQWLAANVPETVGSMLLSYGLTGGAGGYGMAMGAVDAGGDYTNRVETYQQRDGLTPGEARERAAAEALAYLPASVALEKLSMNDWFSKSRLAQEMVDRAGRAGALAVKAGGQAVSEAPTEMAQTLAQLGIQYGTSGNPEDLKDAEKRLAEAGILGAVTGGAMGAVVGRAPSRRPRGLDLAPIDLAAPPPEVAPTPKPVVHNLSPTAPVPKPAAPVDLTAPAPVADADGEVVPGEFDEPEVVDLTPEKPEIAPVVTAAPVDILTGEALGKPETPVAEAASSPAIPDNSPAPVNLKKDGTPYGAGAIRLVVANQKKKGVNAEAVEVEGGFGWRVSASPPPVAPRQGEGEVNSGAAEPGGAQVDRQQLIDNHTDAMIEKYGEKWLKDSTRYSVAQGMGDQATINELSTVYDRSDFEQAERLLTERSGADRQEYEGQRQKLAQVVESAAGGNGLGDTILQVYGLHSAPENSAAHYLAHQWVEQGVLDSPERFKLAVNDTLRQLAQERGLDLDGLMGPNSGFTTQGRRQFIEDAFNRTLRGVNALRAELGLSELSRKSRQRPDMGPSQPTRNEPELRPVEDGGAPEGAGVKPRTDVQAFQNLRGQPATRIIREGGFNAEAISELNTRSAFDGVHPRTVAKLAPAQGGTVSLDNIATWLKDNPELGQWREVDAYGRPSKSEVIEWLNENLFRPTETGKYRQRTDEARYNDEDRLAQQSAQHDLQVAKQEGWALSTAEYVELKSAADGRGEALPKEYISAENLPDGTEVVIEGETFTVNADPESDHIKLEDGVLIKSDLNEMIPVDRGKVKMPERTYEPTPYDDDDSGLFASRQEELEPLDVPPTKKQSIERGDEIFTTRQEELEAQPPAAQQSDMFSREAFGTIGNPSVEEKLGRSDAPKNVPDMFGGKQSIENLPVGDTGHDITARYHALRKAIPGADVAVYGHGALVKSEAGIGEERRIPAIRVKLPNGKEFTVLLEDAIPLSDVDRKAAVTQGYSPKMAYSPDAVVNGEWIGPYDVMRLSKGASQRTINHETWHMAKDLAGLTEKEQAILDRRFGGKEELEAKAYEQWNGRKPDSVFMKVRDFFRRIWNALFAPHKNVFRKVRHGEVYNREPQAGTGKGGIKASIEEQPSLRARQTHSPEFKRWFGDWEADPASASKVVDENGEPLVVYHGTGREFDVFESGKSNGMYVPRDEFYFTLDKAVSDEFFGDTNKNNGQVYLNLRNPADLRTQVVSGKQLESTIKDALREMSIEQQTEYTNAMNDGFSDSIYNQVYRLATRGMLQEKQFIDALKRAGYDGLIFDDQMSQTQFESFVAFSPTQIKSATGNRGTFDPENPNILYSGVPGETIDAALDMTLDLARRMGVQVKHRADNLADLMTRLPRALQRNETVLRQTEVGREILSRLQNLVTDENTIAGRLFAKAEPAMSALNHTEKNWIRRNFKAVYEAGGVEGVAQAAGKLFSEKSAGRINAFTKAFDEVFTELGDLAVGRGVMVRDETLPPGFHLKSVAQAIEAKTGQKVNPADLKTKKGGMSVAKVRDLLGLQGPIGNAEALAAALDVSLDEIHGSWRKFAKIDNYFPRTFTGAIRKALRRGPGDATYDELIKVAKAAGIDPKTILHESDFAMAIKRNGHLENARIANLPATLTLPDGHTVKVWEDDPFDALIAGIDQSSRRLAIILQFGQFGATRAAEEIGQKLFKGGVEGRGGAQKEAFEDVWKQLNEKGHNKFSFLTEAMRGGENIARLAQLSTATISQLSGVMPMAARTGTWPMAQRLAKVVYAGAAARLGIATRTQAELQMTREMGAWMLDTIGHTAGVEDMAGLSRKLAHVGLTANLFNATNRGLNQVAGLLGMDSLTDAVLGLRDPKSGLLRRAWGLDAASMRERLRREFNFTDAEINRMVDSGIDYADYAKVREKAASDPAYQQAYQDLARAAQMMSARTNVFRETALTRPGILSGKASRVFFAYLSYLRAQGNGLADAVHHASKGNVRPLLTKLVGEAAAGLLISQLKDLFFEREHKEDTPFWVKLLDWWSEAATFGLVGGVTEDAYWAFKTDKPSFVSAAQYEWLWNVFMGGPVKAVKKGLKEGAAEGAKDYYKTAAKATPIVRAADAWLDGPLEQDRQQKRPKSGPKPTGTAETAYWETKEFFSPQQPQRRSDSFGGGRPRRPQRPRRDSF